MPGLIMPLLLLAPVVFAQEQTGPATPAAQSPDTLGTLLSLGLGLVAVIAIIYGCAWLIRRMTGMTGLNNQAIRIVSVLPVGTRERIALVEVGGTQILLGITPSAVRTLHVFAEPVVDTSGTGTGDFSRRLQSMIGRSWSPPHKDQPDSP